MERFDIVAWTPRSVAAPLPASMVQEISSWLPVALGARGESVAYFSSIIYYSGAAGAHLDLRHKA